ncbi:GNAT family N-acetyltransferase [Labrys sp. (in: a-proteobacteria)]|uniref:GNAT family N-acetyltransferase n=1 Tax=Labrys sp. (in: a-proteobacteria) TaxID=1917972 RepID=UPI0039E5E87F
MTTLRRANPQDAAKLGALHVASWRETYAGLMPDAMLAKLSVRARSAMWTRILADPPAVGNVAVYVAEDGGDIVGLGSCGWQRDQDLGDRGFDAEIGAIYILRSHQRGGIGRALMREMARALHAYGLRAVSLWVLRGNITARSFYERQGDEWVAEKEDRRGRFVLVEDAYGWRDLAHLADP